MPQQNQEKTVKEEMAKETKLIVSTNPHIKDKDNEINHNDHCS